MTASLLLFPVHCHQSNPAWNSSLSCDGDAARIIPHNVSPFYCTFSSHILSSYFFNSNLLYSITSFSLSLSYVKSYCCRWLEEPVPSLPVFLPVGLSNLLLREERYKRAKVREKYLWKRPTNEKYQQPPSFSLSLFFSSCFLVVVQ